MVFDACKSTQSLLHTDSSFWFIVWLCLWFFVFFLVVQFILCMCQILGCVVLWWSVFRQFLNPNVLCERPLAETKPTRTEMQTPSRIQYSDKTRIMLCLHTASMCFSFRIFSRFSRNVIIMLGGNQEQIFAKSAIIVNIRKTLLNNRETVTSLSKYYLFFCFIEKCLSI